MSMRTVRGSSQSDGKVHDIGLVNANDIFRRSIRKDGNISSSLIATWPLARNELKLERKARMPISPENALPFICIEMDSAREDMIEL